MATYGTVLQKRAAAFSSLVWNHSPKKSSSARQHHARQGAFSHIPLLATPLHQQCLVHGKQHGLSRRLSTASNTRLFMGSDDDDSSEINEETGSSFNIQALKKETTRLTLRAHKKIGKVSTRIRAVEEQYGKLSVAIDGSSSEEEGDKLLQQLEQAPGVEQYKVELKDLQNRLQKLNWLEEQFGKSPLKSKKELSVEDIQKLPEGEQVVQYIQELDISDDDSQKQKRIEENAKNKRSKKERAAELKEQPQQKEGGRLPYRRYYTEKQVEIRVSIEYWSHAVSTRCEHMSICSLNHLMKAYNTCRPNNAGWETSHRQ